MRDKGVTLSRRKTGGGAVYQDLGNSCFSFLTPYSQGTEYDYKTVNNKILISAFANLNIPVEVAGRNDLHCHDKKVPILVPSDEWISLSFVFRRQVGSRKESLAPWNNPLQGGPECTSEVPKPKQKEAGE
jgi:hypothetical protein